MCMHTAPHTPTHMSIHVPTCMSEHMSLRTSGKHVSTGAVSRCHLPSRRPARHLPGKLSLSTFSNFFSLPSLEFESVASGCRGVVLLVRPACGLHGAHVCIHVYAHVPCSNSRPTPLREGNFTAVSRLGGKTRESLLRVKEIPLTKCGGNL